MAPWTGRLLWVGTFIIILALVDLGAVHGDDLVALLQGALLMRRTSRNLSDDEIPRKRIRWAIYLGASAMQILMTARGRILCWRQLVLTTHQSARGGKNNKGRLTSEVMRVPLSRMPTVEFEVATPVDIASEESWALSGVPIAMCGDWMHNPAPPFPRFLNFQNCFLQGGLFHSFWCKKPGF
jgi:hypothetical protein